LRVRKAEPALHQIGQLLAGRRQPLRNEDSEQIFGLEVGCVQRIGIGPNRAADRRAQRPLVGDICDSIQVGFCRSQAGAVDGVGVEIGIVIIGDQRVGAACGIRLQNVGEQLARVLLTLEVRDVESADARAVRGDLRGLDPAAVRIAEEIVSGRYRFVHPRKVDAGVRALRNGRFAVTGRD